MTTKFTKKQLEKIIKEEVSKLILEEEKPRAAASNSELVDFFLDQAKKISDNPSYRPKPGMDLRKISDLKDSGGAGRVFPPTYKHNRPRIIAKEWGLYRKKILQNKTFWFDVVGKLSTFARREVTNGVTDAHFTVFVQAFEQVSENLAEKLGSEMDAWDRNGAFAQYTRGGYVLGLQKYAASWFLGRLKEWATSPAESPQNDDLLNISKLPTQEQIPALQAFIAQLEANDPDNPNLPQAQQALAALQAGEPISNAMDVSPGTPSQGGGGGGGNSKARRVKLAHKTIKAATPEESVKTFQNRLIKLGYSVGNLGADGDYGGGTLRGVAAFQKKNGLKPDGVVGPNTWGALKSNKAKPGTGPQGADPKTGKGGMKVDSTDSILSKLTSLDSSTEEGYEKIRRVYIKTQSALTASNNMSGVPKDDAAKAARGKLQPFPVGTNRTMQDASELMLTSLKGLMNSGFNVKIGSKDIAFDGPMIRAMVKRVMQNEKLVQESKSYDLDFGKWSKLWK